MSRWSRGQWAKRIWWSTVALAVAGYGVERLFAGVDVAIPYPIVVLILVVLIALLSVVWRVEATPLPPAMREEPALDAAFPEADDGVQAAIRQWGSLVDYAHDSHELQRTIIDLVDERLRLAHSVRRASEPERAHELIGPQLWRFMTEPLTHRVQPRELAEIVAQMEAL